MKDRIGHKNKKMFATKIFNLLTDFKNNIVWTAEDTIKLQSLITRYSKSDLAFVQSKVAFYENKTKQKLTAALSAAKENV